MSYRFDPRVDIRVEVRRVLRANLDTAIGHADRTNAVHEDVHEVRKELKRARAVLKIVRPHLPQYRDFKDRLRDAGRRLGDVRDAAAVVESLDTLRPTLEGHAAADAVDEVRDRLVERRDALVGTAEALLSELVDELRSCRDAVDRLEVTASSPDDVRSGLEREYRRCRAWALSLGPTDSAESFHEWRKRSKEHRYHLELLLGEVDEDVVRFHALTDFLGQGQDVAVMIAVLEAEDSPEFARLLVTRQQALRASALKLGNDVCREPAAVRGADIIRRWVDT